MAGADRTASEPETGTDFEIFDARAADCLLSNVYRIERIAGGMRRAEGPASVSTGAFAASTTTSSVIAATLSIEPGKWKLWTTLPFRTATERLHP